MSGVGAELWNSLSLEVSSVLWRGRERNWQRQEPSVKALVLALVSGLRLIPSSAFLFWELLKQLHSITYKCNECPVRGFSGEMELQTGGPAFGRLAATLASWVRSQPGSHAHRAGVETGRVKWKWGASSFRSPQWSFYIMEAYAFGAREDSVPEQRWRSPFSVIQPPASADGLMK